MILVASPLTEDIYRRIGAREFSNHFDIIIADCLDWIRRFDIRPVFTEKISDEIVRIADRKAFQTLMKETLPDFVLDFTGRGHCTRFLQDECRKINAIYITHHLAPTPTAMSPLRRWKSLLSHPRRTAGKILRKLIRLIRNNNSHPPDISLVAGSKSLTPWILSARAVIKTATPSFFDLAQARIEWGWDACGQLRLPKEGYILFIDDCLALSFDFHFEGFTPIVNTERYHKMLNAFFDRLEHATGLQVIVAAHPNGKEYPGYTALFDGRPLHYDRTALLTCGCVSALTHFSSAINYPVLLRKPIAILTFDQLRKTPQGEMAAMIASTLQRPMLDISLHMLDDRRLAATMTMPVTEVAYDTYVKAYIVDTVSPGANPFDNLSVHLLGRNTIR